MRFVRCVFLGLLAVSLVFSLYTHRTWSLRQTNARLIPRAEISGRRKT